MTIEKESNEILLGRYYQVLEKYVNLASELAPKLDKFGKYKQELQLLTLEFTNRGVTPEDPESLIKLLTEKYQKSET